MRIIKHLKDALYRYDCVTLPGFGAFLIQPSPIRIDRVSGQFYPPQKSVSFNALLVHNDGVLANFIAQREKVSYEKALAWIESDLASWKKRLPTEMILLPGIGELTQNAAEKLQFHPYGKINFDWNATGLQTFRRTPTASVAVVRPKLTEKKPIMETTKKEPLAFTPEKPEEKKPNYLKYAAIGIIAVAVLGSSYYFGDQYLTNERIKSTELAQKQIEKNVQEATFDLGALSNLELNINAEVENTNSVYNSGEVYYSVIAGSFREQGNAERKLAQLQSEGFDAAFAEVNPEGLYRVAYGRFKTKREAFKLLSFVKYTLEEEGWYLAENE